MRWSYLPRWKFTDSCGRPGVAGALHVGRTHDADADYHHATRREFLKRGVAIVGAAGFATVVDPREVFAQVRVFPPPPPVVSPPISPSWCAANGSIGCRLCRRWGSRRRP